jgi:hypothetical protein
MGEETKSILSPRTTISPNIPRLLAVLLPQRLDLGARQPFILAIVPLPDCLGDVYGRVCADGLFVLWVSLLLPRKPLFASDLQQFERSLRAFSGGYVAVNKLRQWDLEIFLEIENSIHMCEPLGSNQAVVPNQRFARRLDSFLAIGGEWDVAAARVSPIE